MNNKLKFFISTLIWVALVSINVFAQDRVAIVGNSLAANMSYFTKIDLGSPSCAWVTNHAVGGDGIVSHGLYQDDITINGIPLPYGYGQGFIANFIEESKDYNYCIFICGTNEFDYTVNKTTQNNWEYAKNLYLDRLDKYLSKCDSKCKIIMILMPDGNRYNNEQKLELYDWNLGIIDICSKYSNVFIEEYPEYMEKMDKIHYNKETNIKFFNELIDKYNINLKGD